MTEKGLEADAGGVQEDWRTYSEHLDNGDPLALAPEEEEGEASLVYTQPTTDIRGLVETATALYEEGVALEQSAQALVITSNQDVAGTADTLSIIAGLLDAIEAKRKEHTQPLGDHLKAFNAAFKTFVEPLNNATTLMKDKVKAYRAEQERIRLAEEEINRKRQEAAREEMALRGEITEPVNLVKVQPEMPKTHHTGFTNLTGKRVWKFEVTDFAKLPDAYKLPDMTTIRSKVIALKVEGEPIPGVRAWQEEEVSVTPKR